MPSFGPGSEIEILLTPVILKLFILRAEVAILRKNVDSAKPSRNKALLDVSVVVALLTFNAPSVLPYENVELFDVNVATLADNPAVVW